jgi:hypothetical protein
MANYRKQRAERKRLRFSAMGKASQRVQSERRMADMPDRLREMAEWDVQNLPRKQGDALGCLQWTDFRTGKVRRWTVRIGDRADRITVEAPGQSPSPSHGWTWFLTQLRKRIS